MTAALVALASCAEQESGNAAAPIERGNVAAPFETGRPMAFSIAVGEAAATTRGHSTDQTYNGGYTISGSEVVAVSVKTTSPANTYRATTPDIKQYKTQGPGNANLVYQPKDASSNTATTEDVQHYWLSPAESATIEAWSWGTGAATMNTYTYDTTSGTVTGTVAVNQIDHPDGKVFHIDENQTGTGDIHELLYMPATTRTYEANQASNPINLYHQLARIVVVVKKEATSSAYVTQVTACTFGSNGNDGGARYMPLQAVWHKPASDHNYGTWDAPSGSADQAVANYRGVIQMRRESAAMTLSSPTDQVVYSAVVIPVTYNSDNKLFVLTTSKSYMNPGQSANITDDYYAYVPTSAVNIEPGKQYTYTLTLTDTRVDATVAITPWDEGTAPTAPETEANYYRVGSVSFRMIPIEGNGSTIADFHLGETEVTNALWAAVMGSKPAVRSDADATVVSTAVGQTSDADDCPVSAIAPAEIDEFLSKLNAATTNQRPSGMKFDYPPKTSWLYAARGGKYSRAYTYYGSNDAYQVSWCSETNSTNTKNSYNTVHAVKTLKCNELGLYDMGGNVQEAVKDGSTKRNIGGGYLNTPGETTGANPGEATTAKNDAGFRLALVPES